MVYDEDEELLPSAGHRMEGLVEFLIVSYGSVDHVQKADTVGKFALTLDPPFAGNKNRFFAELKALLTLNHP
jgi:hypothetical protein